MKISDLINVLTEVKEDHGDLNVTCLDADDELKDVNHVSVSMDQNKKPIDAIIWSEEDAGA